MTCLAITSYRLRELRRSQHLVIARKFGMVDKSPVSWMPQIIFSNHGVLLALICPYGELFGLSDLVYWVTVPSH